MDDVLAPFETTGGRLVPALQRPRPRLTVDPQIRGGYPVIAGSRVPFDVVAALADDEPDADEIAGVYLSVDREAIGDAVSFAQQVADVA